MPEGRKCPLNLLHLIVSIGWMTLKLNHLVIILLFLLTGCSSPTVSTLYKESLFDIDEDSDHPLQFEIGENDYQLKELQGESFPSISQRKSENEGWKIILSRRDLGSFENIGIGLFSPSQSGALIAFSTRPTFDGIWVKDISGTQLKFISIPKASDIFWSNNDKDLYISQRVGVKVQKLYRSTNLETPKEIFSVNSPDQILAIQSSTSNDGLFLEARSANKSEMWFVAFDATEPKLILRSQDASKFYGVRNGDLTKILQIKLNGESSLYECNAECKIAPTILKSILIEDALLFKESALLKYRVNGQARLGWYKYLSDSLSPISLPFQNGSISILKKTAHNNKVSIEVSSWLFPQTSYDLMIDSPNIKAKSHSRLDPTINPDNFKITELEIEDSEGTKIPVSLIQPINSDNLVLMVYGSYEQSFDPSYTKRTLQLLKHGLGVGIAHIRGGAEKGRGWYEATTHGRKLVGVKDLMSISRSLKQAGIKKLGLYGRSAGGLIAARAMIEEPVLFSAVALEVPFVNVKEQLMSNSESRDDLEWGRVEDNQELLRIGSYDPIQNINKANYPPIFISSHAEDTEVPEIYITSFYDKLKVLTKNKLIYRQYSGASHKHFSSKHDSRFADAEISSFLLEHLAL